MLHFVAASASVHAIEENGLILGIMPFAGYESRTINFGHADRLLLIPTAY